LGDFFTNSSGHPGERPKNVHFNRLQTKKLVLHDAVKKEGTLQLNKALKFKFVGSSILVLVVQEEK
jgi:hypothetical protein